MRVKKKYLPSTNITSYILIIVLLLLWGVYSEGKEKKHPQQKYGDDLK